MAEKLAIPMISKDNLKEIMFDEIGFKSRAEKNKLGRASMKIMYHIAEQMMSVGMPFILENNFEDISKEEAFCCKGQKPGKAPGACGE